MVSLVGEEGALRHGQVHSTFQTCNRLVEVQTSGGSLWTTATQPLCLWQGGFCRAGELAPGDQVVQWVSGKRGPARVQAVAATDREVQVFNLVVGESAVFIANGFLARGKPPLPADIASGPQGHDR
jgi:hypothetical protein